MKNYKIFALFMLLGMACTEHVSAFKISKSKPIDNGRMTTKLDRITINNQSVKPITCVIDWKDNKSLHSSTENFASREARIVMDPLMGHPFMSMRLSVTNTNKDINVRDGNANTFLDDSKKQNNKCFMDNNKYFLIENTPIEFIGRKKEIEYYQLKVTGYKDEAAYKAAMAAMEQKKQK